MFLGFLIGTICLIALIRVLTRRRWYGGYHHWGYAHAGPYGWGYGGPRWHGRGRGFLFSILARLEATPTQEKAILGAFDELKDTARELRGTVREACSTTSSARPSASSSNRAGRPGVKERRLT